MLRTTGAPAINDRIDAYWAAHLGCWLEDLRERRITVIAHGHALAGYDGVYALRACEGGLVVSAPHAHVPALYEGLRDRQGDALVPAFLGPAPDAGAGAVVGPASLAYTDGDALVSLTNLHGTRWLTADDAAALGQLRAACDPVEWSHAGIQPGRQLVVACFNGTTIVSAGSWEARGPVRHIGVISHPAYRGNGYATAVGAALTAAAIADGAIPQWQTLISNVPSRAIGLKLGFVERFQSIAVRLRDARIRPREH
jgi:GNAT superfamily N-acetyltransferase